MSSLYFIGFVVHSRFALLFMIIGFTNLYVGIIGFTGLDMGKLGSLILEKKSFYPAYEYLVQNSRFLPYCEHYML